MTGYEPTPELIEATAEAIRGATRNPFWAVQGYRARACDVLAVVVPLIREQIAAEIEASQRPDDDYGVVIGLEIAARVARGEDR